MRVMRGLSDQGDDPGGSIPHSHVPMYLISISGLWEQPWDHYVMVTLVTFSTMGIKYHSSLTPSPWLFLLASPISGSLVTLGSIFISF